MKVAILEKKSRSRIQWEIAEIKCICKTDTKDGHDLSHPSVWIVMRWTTAAACSHPPSQLAGPLTHCCMLLGSSSGIWSVWPGAQTALPCPLPTRRLDRDSPCTACSVVGYQRRWGRAARGSGPTEPTLVKEDPGSVRVGQLPEGWVEGTHGSSGGTH